MPSLDEFFTEAIEQADPTNMVEDEYKYVCAVACFIRHFERAPLIKRPWLARFPVHSLCAFVWLFCLSLSIITGSWGTQTTAGALWGCCPGEVLTSFNRPIRSSRAWQTTSTAWSASWPKNCRWGLQFHFRKKTLCCSQTVGKGWFCVLIGCVQKDIPSEEIKTGEEDDDDNGDNLLKDSNDSELENYSSVFQGPTHTFLYSYQ